MKKNLGKIIKLLIGLGISSMLIIYLVNSIDYEQVIGYLDEANWTYFWIAIVCSGLSHVSRGLRWSILLEDQGLQASKKTLIAGTFFAYFINIIIPRGGELARCTSVNYKTGLPVDKLIGTIVLERVIDFVMLMSCIMLVLLLDFDLFGSFFIERLSFLNRSISSLLPLAIGALIIGGLALFLLYRLRDRFSILSKIYDFIKGTVEGVLSLRKLKRRFLFIGHTLFIWVMYLLMSYLPFLAFTETAELDFVKGMFVFILGGIGMTIPTPGGIGSYHAIIIEGMTQVLETSREVATAFAFSVHGTITLFTITAGIIVSIYIFKGKRNESPSIN